MYVYCVENLLILSATVIVHAGGAIWLTPFAMVLFNMCCAVTVECGVLYPCCMGVFGMFVFTITERRDMGLYEVPLSMLGFGVGTMLANFHMVLCWY